MKILIIEDELPAARRLIKLCKNCDDSIEIVATIQSVKSGLQWFEENQDPELILSDIQLSDDLSFELFRRLDRNLPIIFTTAFDEYAIRAFEYYSIDYLLKPIKEDLLCNALLKFQNVQKRSMPDFDELMEKLQVKSYKRRFLVYNGGALTPIEMDEVAYIFCEEGSTFLVSRSGKKHLIQENLDTLEKTLDPGFFYRANRQMIVASGAIKKIHHHFNQRLKIEVYPVFEKDLFISKLKATEFKNWIGS